MEWIHTTIRDFGRNMGIDDLRLNAAGTLAMHMEGQGDLFLETADNVVLVYLARPQHDLSREMSSKALELCHYRENHPLPVHAALHGDATLVFLVHIADKEFTLPTLELAIGLLGRLHDGVG